MSTATPTVTDLSVRFHNYINDNVLVRNLSTGESRIGFLTAVTRDEDRTGSFIFASGAPFVVPAGETYSIRNI